MRRQTTSKKNQVLDNMEMTDGTNMTIGSNINVDGNVRAANIPSVLELDDGTYTLQCTITDGVPTFEWIASA